MFGLFYAIILYIYAFCKKCQKLMSYIYKYLTILTIAILPITSFCSDTDSQDISVTMHLVNRNYLPGSQFKVYVDLKNLLSESKKVELQIETLNSKKEKEWSTVINLELEAGMDFRIPLLISAPQVVGECMIIANVKNTGSKSLQIISALEFTVHKPIIPKKLANSMIYVPEWEHDLLHLVEDWDKEAPSISWGQVMVCSRKTLRRLEDGDSETIKLVERVLKRQMSVVFLDFSPVRLNSEISLPFDINIQFSGNVSPEKEFTIISDNNELGYELYQKSQYSWNGSDRTVVPGVDMKVISLGKAPRNLVKTGVNPFRFPVVNIPCGKGKGDIVLCQLITDGRLDKHTIEGTNANDIVRYDPLAVQFVMNLISSSINEKLLK
jgi:hypothetical protein